MKKFTYKFMRPAFGYVGQGIQKPAVERIQYPKMEFVSDAAANEYARVLFGFNCFALKDDDEQKN